MDDRDEISLDFRVKGGGHQLSILWKLGTWLPLCIGATTSPLPQNVGITFRGKRPMGQSPRSDRLGGSAISRKQNASMLVRDSIDRALTVCVGRNCGGNTCVRVLRKWREWRLLVGGTELGVNLALDSAPTWLDARRITMHVWAGSFSPRQGHLSCHHLAFLSRIACSNLEV